MTSPTLDPLTLVQLPRTGSYSPNPTGTHALVAVSQYDHSAQSTVKSLRLIRIPKAGEEGGTAGQAAAAASEGDWEHLDRDEASEGASEQGHATVLDGLKYSDHVWVDDGTILYLRPAGAQAGVADLDRTLSDKKAAKQLERRLEELKDEADGEEIGVELWAKEVGKASEIEYQVGSLPTEVGDLKIHRTSSSSALLGFCASVFPPYDVTALFGVTKREDELEKRQEGSSGQTYDGLFIRHWDEWTNQFGKKKKPFVAELAKTETKAGLSKWALHGKDITAPLSKLEHSEVPVGPFGDSSDYDLGADIFVCTCKDPTVNPAWHTRQQIFVVPLFPKNTDEAVPRAATSGEQGATSCPSLSPAAKSADTFGSEGRLAWLEMAKDGYEADRNVVVVLDLATRQKWRVTRDWDRSPTAIWWAGEDALWLKAEDQGYVRLYRLSPDLKAAGSSFPKPTPYTDNHAVTSAAVLAGAGPTSRLLLTMSSYTSPNSPFVLSIPRSKGCAPPPTKSLSPLPSLTAPLVDPMALSAAESIWYPGAEGRTVHGFLLRPPGEMANSQRREGLKRSGKRWPLAFLIHGGPQGAWLDSWSWRWNANVFAAAGYITVAINPTGSTGYGQAFTDAINKNWGGAPYQDLVAGYRFLLDNYPEIDAKRTAALGASYGGYMVNWLMGHNPGFGVFVCHDGVFSPVQTFFATEELYFPEHDLGGTPYEVRAEYEKWNPQNHIGNWSTPALVIHNRLDFRLPESEGIGVFNTLQRRGIPSRFLYFPDESHWVTKPANSIRWHREVLRFVAEWIPEDKEKDKVQRTGYAVKYH